MPVTPRPSGPKVDGISDAARAATSPAGAALAVDVSNLHTGLAVWPATGPPHHWKVSTQPQRTPDELRALVSDLLESKGVSPDDIDSSVLGCVVPEQLSTFEEALATLLGAPPLVVGPGTRTGLDIGTDDPREVGADRIANAVAARERFGAPVIVLDFGTALTVDVVGADGRYVGAVIAPGLQVAAEGLARNTARLGRFDLRPPASAIAADTEGGLQSGLVLGYIGLVEGLLARVQAEEGPAPVVATGDATWLTDLLELTTAVQAYDPLLTLDGLRRVLAKQGLRRPAHRS